MRHDDLQQMRTLRLFDGMAESHVESILRVSFLQRFPAHVELVREGEKADFLHVIIDGSVEVYSKHYQRETTVSILGPGHSFIVAAVLLDRVYLKSARALSSPLILLIPAEVVRCSFRARAGNRAGARLSWFSQGAQEPEASDEPRALGQLVVGQRK
jgi:CRP/FNR family transcriptional activator FtrB